MDGYTGEIYSDEYEEKLETCYKDLRRAIDSFKEVLSQVNNWAIYINKDGVVDFVLDNDVNSQNFNEMITCYQIDKFDNNNGALIRGGKSGKSTK